MLTALLIGVLAGLVGGVVGWRILRAVDAQLGRTLEALARLEAAQQAEAAERAARRQVWATTDGRELLRERLRARLQRGQG